MQTAISLPFSFDSAGLVNHTGDQKKIWQDRVTMVLMTSLGERVMRPDFGSNIDKATFENINQAIPLIKQSIQIAFSQWLGSLTFTNVEFAVDPIDYALIAQVFYRYSPTNELDSVKIKTAVLTRAGDTILESE